MGKDMHFWYTTLARGFVALLAGSAILVIPDMARTLLLLPVAVTFAILGLAAYGVIDSTLVFVSSYMAASERARVALRIQGSIGVLIGILLLSVVFDRVQLEWFLTLAALQALSIFVGEYTIARHEKQHAISVWNYSAAAVALVFACAYLLLRFVFLSRLTHSEISWWVYLYLVALGIAQCLTAARMLYADYSTMPSASRSVSSSGVPLAARPNRFVG